MPTRHATVEPQDVRRALGFFHRDLMAIKVERFEIHGGLLARTLHEGAVVSVGYDQLIIIFVLESCQFILNLTSFIELSFTEELVAFLEKFEHFRVVKGKGNIGDAALLSCDTMLF